MRPRFPYNFRRLVRISFQNIGRNTLLSVATTAMIGLILFIFNVILSLNFLTQSSLAQLGEKVDLILYISNEANLYEVTEMVNNIESIPIVTHVKFTSKEQALDDFLSSYPDESNPFEEFGIANPLPSSIQIITESPDQHGLVIDYVENSAYGNYLMDVESTEENQEIVARLLKVTHFTQKLTIGVIVTFVFGSLLMIMNAIHLSIFTRKREIQIMQLVGARPSMIRFPFLFEGAIYGLFAVAFSLVLLMIFLEGTRLSEFELFKDQFELLKILGLEIAASMIIGILSSLLAINYYLKRNFILDHS